MALHTPEEATLGTLEGEGFAFVRQTFRGEKLRGVFFGSEEDLDNLEALLGKEKVRFKGVVYNKLRSGKITRTMQSFLVNVQQVLSVRAGERADFEALVEA